MEKRYERTLIAATNRIRKYKRREVFYRAAILALMVILVMVCIGTLFAQDELCPECGNGSGEMVDSIAAPCTAPTTNLLLRERTRKRGVF